MSRLLLAWLVLVAALGRLPGNELVVFLPSAPSQLAVQRTLSGDPACAGLTITVASRWRAVEEALARKPALVLAPATFAVIPGWRPELQALVAGSDRFSYELVGTDAGATLATLAQAPIGMLQELPRANAEQFLTTAFPGLVPGRVRLAAKADDVANLLGLELARVCVLTPGMSADARARLAGAMHVLARSRPVWHPMLYANDAEPAGAGRALTGLAPATLAALGFDRLVARDPATPPGWLAPEVMP
jgi:hypothetical protein